MHKRAQLFKITDEQRLQNLIGFESSDLAINEAGNLSDSQAAFHRRRLLRQSVPCVFAEVAIAATLGIATRFEAPALWVGVVILTMVVVGAVLGYPPLLRWLDISGRRVDSITGLMEPGVEVREERYYTNRKPFESTDNVIADIITSSEPRWINFKRTYYLLYVNGVTFSVNARTYSAFRNKKRYTVFYLPRTRTIVAAVAHEDNEVATTAAD